MDKIECPKCHHRFELTDAVAGPLVAAARIDAEAAATVKFETAKKAIEAEAIKKANEKAAEELSFAIKSAGEAKDRETTMGLKLATAQAAQAEAVRKQRELDDKLREVDLTVERRTTEGLTAARRAAEADAEARIGARLAERDQTIASMKATVEDLRRKAEQGSQQTQGEAQELALEAALREKFPADKISPVGKGVQGGDCLQVVTAPDGTSWSGRILWESKATKAWSPTWLVKLRDDGRAAEASVLVIVTTVLPKDIKEFDLVEGVWVCQPKHAVVLAVALRAGIIEADVARRAGQGVETKAALVYDYLVGPRFKARVGAIVEAFTTMREDLESERRAITKQWSKREAQIERVLQGTVGMYGDLQAIAGRSLQEIEGLDLKALEAPR